MRSIIISTVLLLLMASGIRGQENRNAISARLGLSSGFAYQLMVDDFRGYKGLMSFREGGIQITALIESYRPLYLKFTDKMYYYTGMGAHIGYTRFPKKHGFYINPFYYYGNGGHFAPVIGMDAIIGMEFRLDRIPLTFSLDVKPFFELFGQSIFRLSLFDIGFSVKVHF